MVKAPKLLVYGEDSVGFHLIEHVDILLGKTSGLSTAIIRESYLPAETYLSRNHMALIKGYYNLYSPCIKPHCSSLFLG